MHLTDKKKKKKANLDTQLLSVNFSRRAKNLLKYLWCYFHSISISFQVFYVLKFGFLWALVTLEEKKINALKNSKKGICHNVQT